MTTQQAGDLDQALEDLSQKVASDLGMDGGLVKKLEQLESDTSAVKPMAHVSLDLKIPIHDGHGAYLSPKKTTFWKTIHGNAEITAPNDRTSWSVVVTDVVAHKVVFSGSGLKHGHKIPFRYKTGFQTQLRAEAQCSNPQENTTLIIHLEVDY